MKAKKYTRRILIILSMLLVVCIVLTVSQEYLFVLDDHNAWRIKGFYLEEQDSLDVVFMGQSDVYSGIIPGKLFEKYGITSYDYATASQVNLWKSQIKEIMAHQTPKYIIIEINGVVYGDDTEMDDSLGLRTYFDGMPMSINKVETLFNQNLNEEPISYYFPIFKYHGEIKNAKNTLRESLYYKKQGFAALRGVNTQTQIDNNTVILDVDYSKQLPLTSRRESFLIDFLEYCKSNGINNVIFTRFPHKIMREEMVERAYRGNQAEKIIENYGFDFINLERDYEKAGISFETDFYNDDHLNIYGAQKLTDYWGKLLSENYSVTPRDLSKQQELEWNYTVDYTNKFLQKAEERINKGIRGAFYENASLKEVLYNKAS